MIIYTSPVCINCRKLKDTLKENNIDYKEINALELSKDEIQYLSNKANSLNLPIIQINDNYYDYKTYKELR